MKKMFFLIMLFSFSLISCAPADLLNGGEDDQGPVVEDENPPAPEPGRDKLSEEDAERLRKSFLEYKLSENQEKDILDLYTSIDPKKMVPQNLLNKTILFYHTNIDRIRNPDFITIIDFSARSSKRRMFLINMKSGEVTAYHVAHGRGSDKDNNGYADRFSNTPNSHASSIGYYIAAETYYGNNGRSLRLDGISDSNSNARKRDVVIHGSHYVKDYDTKPGRSWGCPALPMKLKDKFIDRIKEGSLIYAGLSKAS